MINNSFCGDLCGEFNASFVHSDHENCGVLLSFVCALYRTTFSIPFAPSVKRTDVKFLTSIYMSDRQFKVAKSQWRMRFNCDFERLFWQQIFLDGHLDQVHRNIRKGRRKTLTFNIYQTEQGDKKHRRSLSYF